ncbi:diguanylate cyclase (GGDEF)-like protein/PAS domain S-box-containing protein [Sporosarcina luteola]|nr:diguanylate cyclase (GGDEF)-like protein/PAS domain S-box-containing protein [Sporosarcina luteola]
MSSHDAYYIIESNQYCEKAGMNPNEISRPKQLLTDQQLASKRHDYSEILSVVQFFSNKLLDSLKGTPILVVVSDANGYLLEIEGDETIKGMIEKFGIKPGSLFVQEDTGTNVISLALQHKHPISIIGSQHYHTFLHDIACYGTAFHYTDDNNLLGSVSIMLPIQYQNPLFLTMLTQSVDSIERELLLRKQNRKLYIMNQIMMSQTRNGIVITDQNGITTEFNAFAEELSGNRREEVIGRNIIDSPITGAYFQEVLEHGKMFTNEEIQFTSAAGKHLVCLFDAQPIYEGDKMIGAFGQFRDISDRYFLQEKFNYLAYHDDLTGLPNRRCINEEIEKVIQDINEGQTRALALIFIDLDRFKVINDNFSHSYGDMLLKKVSERLSGCLGEHDILARMGGDEFIFLLKDFEHPDYVTAKAEEVLHLFNESFYIGNDELHTTASIGVALYPDYPISMEKLMIYADNAMYQAKKQGKNRYNVYTSELLEEREDDYKLEIDLRKAIEHEEFVLHYQPQIHSKTGNLMGMEALIRWQHPVLGLLYPDKFIQLAEENGLINQIGKWVINEACAQSRKWQDAGLQPLQISVNLSTQQFLTNDLVAFMKETLHRNGVDPKFLIVEITEYMAMEYEYSLKVLKQLQQLGIGISIDDFGTGYSSLTYLQDFPIDYIKIDKSFVMELGNGPQNAFIVKAIITMGHNLQMRVIAEGVETEEQLKFLIDQQCDIVQGFYFSKPLPANEFEDLYLRIK